MNEFIINTAALLILLGGMQLGMRSGAVSALSWMLSGVFSFFVTMRYWFLLCRWAVGYGTLPLPIMATICFWVIFLVVFTIFRKVCEKGVHKFESTAVSSLGRYLGAVFGIVSGSVLTATLLLTFSILTPQYFATEQPILPTPLDSLPTMAYRAVETHLAQVSKDDPAHTPLPKFRNTDPNPAAFWQ